MEVVGQLTGGLAHDFNNLLMIIGGNLDLIRRRISDDRIAQKIDQVLLAVQRGAKLTQQLLAFSRTQTLSPESICINNLLPEIEMLIFRALGPEIEVGFELARGSLVLSRGSQPAGICNPESCDQRTGCDGERRKIDGRRRRIVCLIKDEAAALGDIAPGRYVAVTLTDTGAGIPSHILSRVFEPFYTTKEVGKGSGLGLSQVYGFARQSGGHVSIRSDVGRGTSVCLYFPWTEPVDAVGAQSARSIEPVSAGQPKVLIVEDDHELRELATQLVQGLGYSVCTASNGAEAMAALESRFEHRTVIHRHYHARGHERDRTRRRDAAALAQPRDTDDVGVPWAFATGSSVRWRIRHHSQAIYTGGTRSCIFKGNGGRAHAMEQTRP